MTEDSSVSKVVVVRNEEGSDVESGGESSTFILVSVERDGMNKWALWNFKSHDVSVSSDFPGLSFSDALNNCACVLSVYPIKANSDTVKKPQISLKQFCELYIELNGAEVPDSIQCDTVQGALALLGVAEGENELASVLKVLGKACNNTPRMTMEALINLSKRDTPDAPPQSSLINPAVQPQPIKTNQPVGPFIVRIRGLTMATTEEDIRTFFVPLSLSSVVLVGTRYSHPTFYRIEGFIEFATEDDADAALKKNGQVLNGMNVEVYLSNASERESVEMEASVETNRIEHLHACVKHMKKQDPQYRGFLRMRGLPYDATEQDIVSFFDGYDIVENNDSTPSVYIIRNSENRPDGSAFVEFQKESVTMVAYNARNKHMMGKRYIELFVCSRYECLKALEAQISRVVSASSEDFTVVRLRGLPWRATVYDITEFFAPLSIAPDGVHIVLNREGRSSGEGYVQFTTSEDALKALQRNRQCINRRYIEVFKATQQEYESASRFFADNTDSHHHHHRHHDDHDRPYDSYRGSSRGRDHRDRDDGRGWSPRQYDRGRETLPVPTQSQYIPQSAIYAPPAAAAYPQTTSAFVPQQQYIPQPYGIPASQPSVVYGQHTTAVYVQQPVPVSSGQYYPAPQQQPLPLGRSAPKVETCNVRVWNLPTTAGQKDLENVFAGFGFTSIRMRTDEQGRWCATITFETPEEAASAIAARHMSIVGSNRICVQPEQ